MCTTSRKPSVVTSPHSAPRCSSTAFVATVVPWKTPADVRRLDPGLAADLPEPCDEGPTGIVRSRANLVDVDGARLRVVEHEVREGAADVDADDAHATNLHGWIRFLPACYTSALRQARSPTSSPAYRYPISTPAPIGTRVSSGDPQTVASGEKLSGRSTRAPGSSSSQRGAGGLRPDHVRRRRARRTPRAPRCPAHRARTDRDLLERRPPRERA